MTAEEKLQDLMKQGYNISIECKSSERVFALSYEAAAYKDGIYTAGHAIGNTLDELADNLVQSINLFALASIPLEPNTF